MKSIEKQSVLSLQLFCNSKIIPNKKFILKKETIGAYYYKTWVIRPKSISRDNKLISYL